MKKEKKTTGKSDKKKREPKFKRDNMLGLGRIPNKQESLFYGWIKGIE